MPVKGALPAVHVGLPGAAFAQPQQQSSQPPQPLHLPPHAQSRVAPRAAGAQHTEHLTKMALLCLRAWQHWAPALVACSLFFALVLLRGVWRALQRWQVQQKFGPVDGGGGEQLVEMGGMSGMGDMGLRAFVSAPQQAAEQSALRAGTGVAVIANSSSSAARLATATVSAVPVHPTTYTYSYAQLPDTGRGGEAESFGFGGSSDAGGIML